MNSTVEASLYRRQTRPLRPVAALALAAMLCGVVWANDKKEGPAPAEKTATAPKADIEASPSSDPKAVGDKVRSALGGSILPNKKLTLVVDNKTPGTSTPRPPERVMDLPMDPAISPANRQLIRARAAALSGGSSPKPPAKPAAPSATADAHWNYEGEYGPQAWGQLKPEFNLCAIGKRQSPINIDEAATLQGPAEPIQFSYAPSLGTVINNGHTIQVDVQGDNSITVRGSNYRLLQFHFHSPSEEQVNFKRFAMVAHLVHRNTEGQLAVVAVLLEPGNNHPFIDRVWTYMPLDAGDRVRMPPDILNLNDLLPTDQRYYQFMGSLTTPPCTEGVLWLVMKQPVQISKNQLRLFTQLYPNNARPIQPHNGRPVREAL